MISYADLLFINRFTAICRALYPFRFWSAFVSFFCVVLLNIIVFVKYFYIRDLLVVVTIWSFYFWLVAYTWGSPNTNRFKKYWLLMVPLAVISVLVLLVSVPFTVHTLFRIYITALGT